MTESTVPVVIHIPIAPCPAPRQVRSDAWRPRPMVVRYRAFRDKIRTLVRGSLEPQFEVEFHVPMPPTWSKKKKATMAGQPHQNRPDLDNYLKAFIDALCEEDKFVYAVRASKFWAEEGEIILKEGL